MKPITPGWSRQSGSRQITRRGDHAYAYASSSRRLPYAPATLICTAHTDSRRTQHLCSADRLASCGYSTPRHASRRYPHGARLSCRRICSCAAASCRTCQRLNFGNAPTAPMPPCVQVCFELASCRSGPALWFQPKRSWSVANSRRNASLRTGAIAIRCSCAASILAARSPLGEPHRMLG
jgi:hypothetical protein